MACDARRVMAAAGAVILLLLAFAGGRLLSEEKISPERKKELERIRHEPRYGNFWGPFTAEEEGGKQGYMALDMKGLFEYEAKRWSEKYGRKNPFTSCTDEAAARFMWFSQWAASTCSTLSKKGWTLCGTYDGGIYVFRQDSPPSTEPPRWIAKMIEGEPLHVPPARAPIFMRIFYFPFTQPYRPTGDEAESFVKAPYASRWILIPPWAHSLRIYSTNPLDTMISFKKTMPYLHSAVWDRLIRVHYSQGRFNVLQIDFKKEYDYGFWDWRLFGRVMMRCYTKMPSGERKFPGDPIFGWEFLDEDGKPLPADLPIATRWFPDNFKEIFKPIPLPEELKNLPEAQD